MLSEIENVFYPYSVHVKGYCANQGEEYAILNMPTCVQDCNEDIECVGIIYKHLVCFRLRNCDMEVWTSQNDMFTLLKGRLLQLSCFCIRLHDLLTLNDLVTFILKVYFLEISLSLVILNYTLLIFLY